MNVQEILDKKGNEKLFRQVIMHLSKYVEKPFRKVGRDNLHMIADGEVRRFDVYAPAGAENVVIHATSTSHPPGDKKAEFSLSDFDWTFDAKSVQTKKLDDGRSQVSVDILIKGKK